jgi:hypothetical protein
MIVAKKEKPAGKASALTFIGYNLVRLCIEERKTGYIYSLRNGDGPSAEVLRKRTIPFQLRFSLFLFF